ncbi:hypothetical protein C6502_07245 [Candidatus Poribacteria bacterium]|nr:MAG: hypothetical protein C6502_07245 [Candidatus Poribacteria bacterium]
MPAELSRYAFAPHYVWRNFFDFCWTIIDDQFCLFAHQEGDYFMPILPMGASLNQKVIQQAYRFTLEVNRAKQIARIENVPEGLIPFFHQIGFRAVRKETEYLYETNALVQLKGDRYKSKRAAYNALIRNHPSAQLEPYQPAHLGDCLALYESWQQERGSRFHDDIYQAMLEDSRHSHCTGLMNCEELGLIGRVVFIDGVVKGYTFGYPLNTEIFCILFEVTDLGIKGLAQFLFREFCREQAAYRWINTMDDSGLENLRRVKLSYRPARQLASYNLFLP